MITYLSPEQVLAYLSLSYYYTLLVVLFCMDFEVKDGNFVNATKYLNYHASNYMHTEG
jgi:hypothetical protein